MDFDHYVADYQLTSDPKNWSALDCLSYLKEHVDFSSDSKNDILKAFRRRLKTASQSTAILAGPKKDVFQAVDGAKAAVAKSAKTQLESEHHLVFVFQQDICTLAFHIDIDMI
ncbi:hypothetical protein G9A89_020550 [Geosiphon pyriformis]|nr:hypothetical protein G9A89_020550 [Geosiphon pyriformis]